jgi:hypothetical protein
VRAAVRRPIFEVLEGRLTPTSFFTYGLVTPEEFYPMVGPDVRYGTTWLQTADFNEDGRNDLLEISSDEYGTYLFGSLYLSREDGSYGDPQTLDAGPGPYGIATGDFGLPGPMPADGRPDLAFFNSYYDYASDTTTYGVMVYYNGGPALSFTEYSTVAEGNTGTVEATFGVWLEYATDVDMTVHYETAADRSDATATPGSDYIPTSGDVTIPAGQTAAIFTVPLVSDRLPEPTEVFLVRVNYYQLAYGVILDDDNAPQISVGDATIIEGNSGAASATFTVTLSAASSEAIAVAYDSGNGTATAGSDYQVTSGTLTFAPGEMSKAVTVLVNGDRLPEPNETFVVNLSGATNATIADGEGVGTIVDDEPRVSISDVTKSEGRKGKTTLFTFTVTLSAAYDQPVIMSFRTGNGTATTGDNDYVGKTGTLTFAPGQTSKTITIEVKGDSKRESSETFYIDLFGLSGNAQFTKSRGIGTILNDD